MTLIDRVTTLLRSNLNDLIDRAEDPEKMIKQVILDMEQELKELKSQLAVAVADQHILEKKQKEHQAGSAEWMRKAEIAVEKKEEGLARGALERYLTSQKAANGFEEQLAEQKQQVEDLKAILRGLEQKLNEARSTAELLIAQQRRSRTLGKAAGARAAAENRMTDGTMENLRNRVMRDSAISEAQAKMAAEDVGERIAKLETEDKIDRLLAEIKGRRGPVD